MKSIKVGCPALSKSQRAAKNLIVKGPSQAARKLYPNTESRRWLKMRSSAFNRRDEASRQNFIYDPPTRECSRSSVTSRDVTEFDHDCNCQVGDCGDKFP